MNEDQWKEISIDVLCASTFTDMYYRARDNKEIQNLSTDETLVEDFNKFMESSDENAFTFGITIGYIAALVMQGSEEAIRALNYHLKDVPKHTIIHEVKQEINKTENFNLK